MKISVIIPMYNAEKYLGVCLESILIQTMKDFEVLVVDDCSTDNSCAVAESYLEKFGGRLKIITLSENTGTPGLLRNIGVENAQGKYIFFVDADDFIVDNALEKLFSYAEDYHADIVCMDTGFNCNEDIIPDDLQHVAYTSEKFLFEQPWFEGKNLAERIEKFLKLEIKWPAVLKFSRRSFLLENDITFPASKTCEDGVWSFKVLCLSENFLHVSEPFYVQRFNRNSITRSKRSLEEWVILHVNSIIKNIDLLDEFMREKKIFKENTVARLKILDYFLNSSLAQISIVDKRLDSSKLYEIFLEEFSKAGSTQPALISYLLVMNNLYRNELKK